VARHSALLPHPPARPAAPRRPDTAQAQKSAATRTRLIEATIACLVRHGYARTTTPLVAAEAGLSRGAMLHHFDTVQALIHATIVELHEKRLRAFRRASESHAGNSPGMIRAYWQQLQKPGFIAFHELALAARCDADLAAILLPLQAEYQQRQQELAARLYPEWQAVPGRLALAMALSQTLMEGMATALLTGALEAALVPALLAELETRLDGMRPAPEAAA